MTEAKIRLHKANAGVAFDDELLAGAMIHVYQRVESLVDLAVLVPDGPEDPADQRFNGRDADHLFYAFSGNDELYGGNGADELYDGLGNDMLNGGRGHDHLYGNSGNDVLKGRSGNDNLIGNSGEDDLRGGAGNDTLAGGAGSDRLHGGDGQDIFVLPIDKTFSASGSLDFVLDFALGVDGLDIRGALDGFSDETGNSFERVQMKSVNGGSRLSVDQPGTGDFFALAHLDGAGLPLAALLEAEALIF